MKNIVLGGGCFWCVEAVFERLKGVIDTEVGYSCRRKNKISIWKNKTSIKVEILFFYKP
ncbi:peptide-methionine (S)-S-oxide reductase [Campylobacter jejuni]|nr:peptide-methionine (S)-S-oxide reductase [Campylobacter jejuni]